MTSSSKRHTSRPRSKRPRWKRSALEASALKSAAEASTRPAMSLPSPAGSARGSGPDRADATHRSRTRDARVRTVLVAARGLERAGDPGDVRPVRDALLPAAECASRSARSGRVRPIGRRPLAPPARQPRSPSSRSLGLDAVFRRSGSRSTCVVPATEFAVWLTPRGDSDAAGDFDRLCPLTPSPFRSSARWTLKMTFGSTAPRWPGWFTRSIVCYPPLALGMARRGLVPLRTLVEHCAENADVTMIFVGDQTCRNPLSGSIWLDPAGRGSRMPHRFHPAAFGPGRGGRSPSG